MTLVLTEREDSVAIRLNRERTREMVRNVAQSSAKRAEEIARLKIQKRYREYVIKRLLVAVLVPTCLYLWWPTIAQHLGVCVL